MPDLYDKDGNPVEGALTPDEVEAQKKAAIEEATKPLASQLETAQKELEGLKNKDMNFGNLRKTAEEKEKEIEALQKKIDELPVTIQAQLAQQEQAKSTEALIKQAADGDAELEKKIKFHLETTLKGVEAKTPEEVAAKIKNAYVLAKPAENVPDVLNSTASSAGAGGMPPVENPQTKMPQPLADLTKKVAAAGGIVLTDDDIKKYDKK